VALFAADNVTEFPKQIVKLFAVAVIASGVLTVTVTAVRGLSHPVVGFTTDT
jgi:flagellar biosynthesis protein FlhB